MEKADRTSPHTDMKGSRRAWKWLRREDVVDAVHNERREASVSAGRKVEVRWQIKVVSLALMVVFTALILEAVSYAYLRVFDGYDGKHLMLYQFDGYKNIRLTPDYHNTNGVYHNSQGFRRKEDISKKKSAGTYRIFIMGGSTAYGLQSMSKYGKEKFSVIRNDQTIDYFLEEYLRGKVGYERVEVVNAAITSFQSHHHLIYLNESILKYMPDMVIFIDGFNDYYAYEAGFDQFRDYAYQERAHLFMGKPTFRAWLGYSGWWLFRKSHFIHVAGGALRPVWLQVSRAKGDRPRIDVEEALRNLRTNAEANFVKMVERIGLILKNEDVVPVFTLQPELVFRQRKVYTEMERHILKEMENHWQEHYVEFKNRARGIVIEYLKRASAKTGALFFDLTDIYGGVEEDVYTDYCHLTPIGNKRLAEYLGEQIVPIIQRPPGIQ